MIQLMEGVSKLGNGYYYFYWKGDKTDDIIFLNEDTSGVSVLRGVNYIYGYEFNEKCDKKDISQFRNALKYMLENNKIFFSNDINEFVEEGLYRLDKVRKLDSFKVLVSIESTEKGRTLVNIMDKYLYDMLSVNQVVDIQLLKELCSNVTFDIDKVRDAFSKSKNYRDKSKSIIDKMIKDAEDQFEEAKSNNEIFKMKKYLPLPIREGFSNFLKFKCKEDEELYKLLDEGTEVLICEDFITSGSTIQEVKRLLESVNPNNHLTVFALINQLREV